MNINLREQPMVLFLFVIVGLFFFSVGLSLGSIIKSEQCFEMCEEACNGPMHDPFIEKEADDFA